MKYSTITGLGHYVPSLRISNDDLAQHMDTSDEWIYTRTGIRHRHIAVDERVHEMAANAAAEALKASGIEARDIELIVVGSFSTDYATPSVACLVQKEIGAKDAMCFDLNAACSGFVYGLDVADQFLRTGKYSNALVIGSEKISQILDWDDRSTCVLFGDGAGAAVMSGTEEAGIIATKNLAIGEDFQCLFAKNTVNDTLFYEGSQEHKLYMNGQDVFQFACNKVPEIIHNLLEEQNTSIEEIDLFVLHQANARIIAKIAKRLKIPNEKFYMNMERFGNTSAASIPIALSELSSDGSLKGKKVVIAGFGAGLTYGASLIQF